MKHNITYHSVPRETFEITEAIFRKQESKLNNYIDQLLWWNKRINLVSRDVSRGTITLHVLHSLLLRQFEVFQSSDLIVDAGTGGGLPGIPLAIANPGKHFLLNDIVSKKMLAVKQIARKLKIDNAQTLGGSIGKLNIDRQFLLISKHAFKVNDLFNLTNNLPWKTMVLYKGLAFENELDGINTTLSISAYDIYEYGNDEFYKDKALILITR